MKRIATYLILLGLIFVLTSNASQPGVWKAGGSGSFTLLYPEDSIAYKKIQMKSESIYIQLYKGFAVVKGNYNFYNSTNDSISIKVGYPINNVFPQTKYDTKLNQVVVDGLYKIKGKINDVDVPIFQSPNAKNDNWYVWNLKFPPNKELHFSIHFIVNTNNSKITQGYNVDYKNAFIYLIETGSLWKSPIEKGVFYVNFDNSINLDDIKLNAPSSTKIDYEERVLKMEMTNYGLQPDNNLIITYSKQSEDFNFKNVIEYSENYFSKIDQFSASDLNLNYVEGVFEDAYVVENSFLKSLLLYSILFLSLAVLFIFVIYKLFKRIFK